MNSEYSSLKYTRFLFVFINGVDVHLLQMQIDLLNINCWITD